MAGLASRVLTGYPAALPVGLVPSSIAVSPGHISGSDLEARGFAAHSESPDFSLPVALCLFHDTCLLSKLESTFRSSFPEEIKEKPTQAFAQLCWLFAVEWLLRFRALAGCLHYLLLSMWYLQVFKALCPFTYQLFILHVAVLEQLEQNRQSSFTKSKLVIWCTVKVLEGIKWFLKGI